jgi:hypothetical protein
MENEYSNNPRDELEEKFSKMEENSSTSLAT